MGDEIVSNVVGTMLEPIRDSLYAFISRQFGYLVQCKKNIKDFEDEVEKLKDAMEMIQTRVHEAENNAEVIEKNVSKWLDEVQSTLRTMEQVRNRLLQNAENLQCLDVCSRYRLGKEGKKKKPVVTKLLEDGNNFGTIGHRPPLTRTWHTTHTINYESFESRDLVFNDILEALKDDRNYKIGIHGMPGVGKTRMMEQVAKQAREDKLFDEIAKTVVSENPNLEKIQNQLAEALNLTLDKDTEGARRELLHNRLKTDKRILVMVDDLWNDGIKLEDIGIPATGDHTKGCKILLTSRRRDVCEAMGVLEKENFQIGILSKDEAWSLFEKKVGYSIEPREMLSVAKAVCKECAGLPLAILAVGGALKSKSKQVWQDALKQLRNFTAENIAGLPAKLYSPIELSYNHLEPVDAKSIFLLCCLFPEDAEISIDYLVMHGVGLRLLRGVDTIEDARNRTHALVATLKTSSLLLQGNEEHLVKMHDVIRDVAISIASKEEEAMFLVKAGVEKWPEENEYKRCRTISLTFNDDCVLPYNLECPELRTLMLKYYVFLSETPSSFFKGMEKLEVLDLEDTCIRSLPSSLKNLRMLRLHQCELVNVAFLKKLKKLEILSIEDFDLKKLAPEIQQLSLLRLLDLRGCNNLRIVPAGVISSLSQLEELYIPDEFDKWEVEGNASLMELNSLSHLVSLQVHVPNVELLPLNDELLFKSLIRFQISIGSKFLYNEICSSATRTATRILKLVGFPLKKRGLNILMEKAEVMFLIQLEGLNNREREGEEEGERFLDLKYLEVKKCDGVEHLFGKSKLFSQTKGLSCAYGSFSQLSVLEVDNYGSSCLFSAATTRALLQLQELNIKNCKMLEKIISNDQEVMMEDTVSFHRLKKLELHSLPNLRSFCVNLKKTSTTRCNNNRSTLMQTLFNHKIKFPALEELKIYDLKSLRATWDNELFSSSKGEDSFRRLRNINVRKCHKLVNVFPPNALPLLEGLEILEVRECDSLVYGVEIVATKEGSHEIIVFSRLKTMKLKFLPNFKSFCCFRNNILLQQEALFNHKVRFPTLEELKIKELKSFTAIWDNQLLLGSCAQDSFRQQRLVDVEGCEKLVKVIPPNVIPTLHMLESLEIVSCDSLISRVEVAAIEEGSDEILMFPQLKKLKLEELPKLSSLCCSRKGGEQKVVEESNNSHPQALFNHKTHVEFPMLEKLVCDGSIFEGIWLGHLGTGSISKVRVIEMKKYNNIVNGCKQLLQWFEVVEEVSLKSCYSLEVIFNLEGVDDAIQRNAIIVMSSQLQKLRLESLPKLNHIWITDSGGLLMFHNLTYLTVEKCKSLSYLFSLSMARRLTQLKGLVIRFCYAMEEIVVKNEEQGKEEDSIDEIVFPKLYELCLETLPKLTSFCGANNAAFKFPSLNMVLLLRCLELQTFASGGITTPPDIIVCGDDRLPHNISEINKYVEQQYVGKGKGLQKADNEDEGTSS